MTRFWMKVLPLAIAVSLPLLCQHHAAAQSTTIVLSADEGSAEASNDGVYPTYDIGQGETLYYGSEPDGLWAYVQYWGPEDALLTCDYEGGQFVVGVSATSGYFGTSFSYYLGNVGTNYVKCSANGVTAEVQYKILPGDA